MVLSHDHAVVLVGLELLVPVGQVDVPDPLLHVLDVVLPEPPLPSLQYFPLGVKTTGLALLELLAGGTRQVVSEDWLDLEGSALWSPLDTLDAIADGGGVTLLALHERH